MEAIQLIQKLKGCREKAPRISTLEAQQKVCQEDSSCDCRGCSDSG